MASKKVRYEQRSVLNALKTYLEAAGYSDITYTDGYQPEGAIKAPQVTVTFPPSGPKNLQLGRVKGEDSFYRRSVVVNCYMETEGRASDLVDDIIEFIEFTCVDVKDHTGAYLGFTQCANPDAIVGQVFPPIMGDPKSLRWRGAVTAPFDTLYPNL